MNKIINTETFVSQETPGQSDPNSLVFKVISFGTTAFLPSQTSTEVSIPIPFGMMEVVLLWAPAEDIPSRVEQLVKSGWDASRIPVGLSTVFQAQNNSGLLLKGSRNLENALVWAHRSKESSDSMHLGWIGLAVHRLSRDPADFSLLVPTVSSLLQAGVSPNENSDRIAPVAMLVERVLETMATMASASSAHLRKVQTAALKTLDLLLESGASPHPLWRPVIRFEEKPIDVIEHLGKLASAPNNPKHTQACIDKMLASLVNAEQALTSCAVPETPRVLETAGAGVTVRSRARP